MTIEVDETSCLEVIPAEQNTLYHDCVSETSSKQ